ncbi:MAG: J domain-containing protein [Rhodocyclaceae bacterium]|nr:J domain-containing protein [Rhodocyclaceae bacterium]MBK6908512.1 J domain-containing protein [Rhodocyclaceae bacterium]
MAISTKAGAATLSKAQKAFNTLIKKIDVRRKDLAAWEVAIPAYQTAYTERLIPLRDELLALKVRMVLQLDEALLQKGLSQTDRDTMSDLLLHLAGPLMDEQASDELKAAYNRHVPSAPDADSEADLAHDSALLREQFEEEFGIDLGEDFDLGTATPEDLLQRIHAQAQRQAEADEARRAKRKKTKKQLEKEARAEAAEKDVSQALREVFRKLASALHPDREADPAERARKTALMQRANQAYDKRNLLQLLELQLELEHIDAAALAGLSEERLKHFNQILKDQLAELDMEIMQTEARFCYQFGLTSYIKLVPEVLPRLLEVELIKLRQMSDSLAHDFRVFANPKALKVWLKDIRRELAAGPAREDGIPF